MKNRSNSSGPPRRRAVASTGVLARILVLLVLPGFCNPLSADGCPEMAGDPSSPEGTARSIAGNSAAAERSDEAPPSPSPGQRAYVDPQTGQLLDHPPPGEPPEAPAEPPAALPDIPVQVRPDGTVVADIGDRFMIDLNVEIVEGRVVTCHRAVEAEGGQKRNDPPPASPEGGDGR